MPFVRLFIVILTWSFLDYVPWRKVSDILTIKAQLVDDDSLMICSFLNFWYDWGHSGPLVGFNDFWLYGTSNMVTFDIITMVGSWSDDGDGPVKKPIFLTSYLMSHTRGGVSLMCESFCQCIFIPTIGYRYFTIQLTINMVPQMRARFHQAYELSGVIAKCSYILRKKMRGKPPVTARQQMACLAFAEDHIS